MMSENLFNNEINDINEQLWSFISFEVDFFS
jgi:hypothetical protein